MADASAEAAPYRLLFVCTGNTCRSPLAQEITRARARELGWSQIEVRSAGVGAATGEPASGGAVRVAASHGLDLSKHHAELLTPEVAAWADLILVMSPSHLMRVIDLGGGERVAMLTSFALGEGAAAGGMSVPDPIGGSDDEYEETYRRLATLVGGVLERLQPVVAP